MTSHERDRQLKLIARELRTVDPGVTYFAATLVGDDVGWRLSWQTRFAGWPEGGGPAQGVELREAAPVCPDQMSAVWRDLNQPWIVVTHPAHLVWFLRLGGNALVSDSVAFAYYRSSIQPRKVAPNGPVGFVAYDPDALEAKQHAPTKKQRLRVLKRDGYRCQLCGERPSNNPHITLHVHHVRPFSRGGLTIDENLITLCGTCHSGLAPHEDLLLFWLPGGHFDRALLDASTSEFEKGVEVYRRRIAPAFERLDSHAQCKA